MNKKLIERYALILMLLIECRKNNLEVDYEKANIKLGEINIEGDDNYTFILNIIYKEKPSILKLDKMLHDLHKKNPKIRQKAFEYGEKNDYFLLEENYIPEFVIDEDLLTNNIKNRIEKLIEKMNSFLLKKNYDCYVHLKYIFAYDHTMREYGYNNFFAITIHTLTNKEFNYISKLLVKIFLKDFQKIIKK